MKIDCKVIYVGNKTYIVSNRDIEKLKDGIYVLDANGEVFMCYDNVLVPIELRQNPNAVDPIYRIEGSDNVLLINVLRFTESFKKLALKGKVKEVQIDITSKRIPRHDNEGRIMLKKKV